MAKVDNSDYSAKVKILLPKIELIGKTKIKTIINNFIAICKQLNRHPEQLMNFFMEQLGNIEASIGDKGLILQTLAR
jgi:translation initiation factor 2 beta subunit (eIF-2beta)/eIF-5